MKKSKFISKSDVLPINLYAVKEHLGIFHDEKNSNLTTLMKAAVAIAEKFTGQVWTIGANVIDQYCDNIDRTLVLDYAPATGITHVKYFDSSNAEQTLATGYYNLLSFTTPQQVEFDYDMSVSTYNRYDAVVCRYVCGYAKAADVPSDVKAAMLLIVQQIYDNPDDAVRQLPTTSEYLLRNYKIH
jgi:uncharacterized phiE125 gp8 family phage protein